MNRSDRVRRAVSLTLAVLCFLMAPQLAFGQFTSSKAPTMDVGTAALVTPTAVTGTYRCRTGGFLFPTEGADVSVAGFTDAGQPAGVSYVYTLYRGNDEQAKTTQPIRAASLTTGLDSADWGSTTYRLTIVTKVGLWTSAEYSKSFTCGTWWAGSGSL